MIEHPFPYQKETGLSSDSRIRASFSKAAEHYEEYSAIQKDVGLQLLERIDVPFVPRRILDVGMGTGWLTKKAAERFSTANVVGLDFADGMVRYAGGHYDGFFIAEADAERLPFKNDCFDLIFSNASYQWVKNLSNAFGEVKRILRSEGKFSFTCFGRRSLKEMFFSLQSAMGKTDAVSVFGRDRTDKKDVLAAMQKNDFQKIRVQTEIVRIMFSDMFALMKWLKSVGANGERRNFFLGKNVFQRASDYYGKNFSQGENVFASFEIIRGEGIRG